MEVEPEHTGPAGRFMDAHVVEDQRPPLGAVGEDVDGGVLPGDELAVEPDQSIDFGRLHGADCTGSRGLYRELAVSALSLLPSRRPVREL